MLVIRSRLSRGSSLTPDWAKQLPAQSEGMRSTLRAIAAKRPHESEREESDTEDTLQRQGNKEQPRFNKRMKTVFKNIVSRKDEQARVVEEARKGMESVEDRNLAIRMADSDGWVVAKKFYQKLWEKSEEDRRRLREARQGGKRQGSNMRERGRSVVWLAKVLVHDIFSPGR